MFLCYTHAHTHTHTHIHSCERKHGLIICLSNPASRIPLGTGTDTAWYRHFCLLFGAHKWSSERKMKLITAKCSLDKKTTDELCLDTWSQVIFSITSIGHRVQTILRNYLRTLYGTRSPEEFGGCGFLASVATSSERAERWAPVFDTNSPMKNY